ncbi:DUF397 domain-containing protein [Streptomyces sp. NPDC059524]|uniref:DUF397 domain-containing protein n=1 Tax=Streptomyces sp. NPDC059524 TaxID=3346856 RepID=UPI0036A916B9
MNRETNAGSPTELAWFKSTYSSGGDEPDCVEVAHTPGTTHVRDSKKADGARLTVSGTAWAGFLGGL